MANLNETDQWVAGIYQLEEDDPVLGGPTGIDNRPPRELASRTLYQRLRNVTPWDATLSYPANVAHVSHDGTTWKSVGESTNVAPGTDATKWVRWGHTAAELKAACGESIAAHEAKVNPHPQYATDVDLAAHVSAADPHAQYVLAAGDAMSGPLGLVDAGQFDNSNKAASTAHVQRALGNYSGARNISVSGNNNLTPADMGRYISVSASGVNLSLPAGNTIVSGAAFIVGPSQRCVISRTGTDGITTPTGSPVTSMALFSPAIVTWRGDIWHVIELPMGGDADTGEVFFTARSTPPPGSIKANFAAVSRTTYSRLFAAIGTTYGPGDGVSTFNVPEGRGEFFRALDDGRGIDVGRVLGSAQAATRIRSFLQDAYPNDSDGLGAFTGIMGIVAGKTDARGLAPDGTELLAQGQLAAGSLNDNVNWGARGNNVFDSINTYFTVRPRNLALLACIKY